MKKEYCRRIRVILKNYLNAANRFEAINTLAVPALTYSFNWKRDEIKKLDTESRKLLNIQRMHYPKIDIDRLYLLRTSGGRGLTQVVTALKTKPIGLE